MQYCTHCKVQLLETRKHCPLCGNSLKIETDQTILESFPKIDSYIKGTGKLKLLLFLSVVIIILSFTVYAFFPTELNYPLLITLGMGSLWLDMIFLVKRRFHIPKKIVWQVFILAVLSLFWDWNTGWRGWSITYFIPFLYITALLLMYAIAVIMKLNSRDYITYAFMSALFGILPVLFIMLDWVTVTYPSILSIAFSSTILSAIFILQWDSIKLEFQKRMHI